MKVRVYIVTWCKQVESLYGTILVFPTLRVGFPTAEINVVDNASLDAVRQLLRSQAEMCGAAFTELTQEKPHHELIEQILESQAEGAAIFVDPDVCFWKSVEEWRFDALMAGRLLPKYACEYTACITHPRLHTSFLWIPDVRSLRDAIRVVRARFFDFHPFRPIMCRLGGVWQRWDTGASLYAALPERMHPFTARELEAYDHLFCGTHLGEVAAKVRPDYALLFERMHKHIRSDHRSLKGAWRIQDDYFASLSI
jgi:hypothetical protein